MRNPLGGLSRKASLLKYAREGEVPVFFADSGDLHLKYPEMTPAEEREFRLKGKLFRKVHEHLRLDVQGVGDLDLALGWPFLKEIYQGKKVPLVCANLFDRAPGRSVKVALICGIAMAAAVGIEPELAFAALVLGAAIGVAYWELGEKLMLGDTGVNVLGAMVALSAVTTLGSGPRWVVLAVVVALNLLSEFVSFSRVIDAVTPLRWFDRLGRPSP